MQTCVNVADLKPEGSDKTYRQLNLERQHAIPIGSIVKVLHYNHDTNVFEDRPECLVLRVILHTRDCDGAPLYSLSYQTPEEYARGRDFYKNAVVLINGMALRGEFFGHELDDGHGEEALKLLALP
jgi:hypothetical protein